MHVALPAATDPRPRTFAPAATAAQRTAEGVTWEPVVLSTTANDTFTRRPARGFAGERANLLTAGFGVGVPTLMVVEAVLLVGFGSVTVRSVACTTIV